MAKKMSSWKPLEASGKQQIAKNKAKQKQTNKQNPRKNALKHGFNWYHRASITCSRCKKHQVVSWWQVEALPWFPVFHLLGKGPPSFVNGRSRCFLQPAPLFFSRSHSGPQCQMGREVRCSTGFLERCGGRVWAVGLGVWGCCFKSSSCHGH